jgi:hypothetical protein
MDTSDTMLPRFHTDFIFTNTEDDAQRLRFKFEIKFDFDKSEFVNIILQKSGIRLGKFPIFHLLRLYKQVSTIFS